jgi:hypothetical protein
MCQNRQPRFTVFISLQDFFSVPPQLKRNADSVWVFSGFIVGLRLVCLCVNLDLLLILSNYGKFIAAMSLEI